MRLDGDPVLPPEVDLLVDPDEPEVLEVPEVLPLVEPEDPDVPDVLEPSSGEDSSAGGFSAPPEKDCWPLPSETHMDPSLWERNRLHTPSELVRIEDGLRAGKVLIPVSIDEFEGDLGTSRSATPGECDGIAGEATIGFGEIGIQRDCSGGRLERLELTFSARTRIE